MMRERERCCECDDPTGCAGKGEDSLYLESGEGPFCRDCYDERAEEETEANSQFGVGARPGAPADPSPASTAA